MRLSRSPHVQMVGNCVNCRKNLYDDKGKILRDRLGDETSRKSLGCDSCPLDGYDNFKYMPRVNELIRDYAECHNPNIGRFTYPYDVAPRKNPLFIRLGFRLIEHGLADRDVEGDNLDGDS